MNLVETNKVVNLCPCGKTVTMNNYVLAEEDTVNRPSEFGKFIAEMLQGKRRGHMMELCHCENTLFWLKFQR